MMAILPATALAFAAPAAHADNDSNFGSGANAANNCNFSAASVCFQELAVVPVGGPWVGNTVNHCVNGNVLDPSWPPTPQHRVTRRRRPTVGYGPDRGCRCAQP